MGNKQSQRKMELYDSIVDASYYFTRAAELIHLLDGLNLDGESAHMLAKLRSLADEVEPLAKRLWVHLENQ